VNRTRRPITILLVDDDEEDLLMTEQALQESRLGNDLRSARDGEELMDYLLRRGQYQRSFRLAVTRPDPAGPQHAEEGRP